MVQAFRRRRQASGIPGTEHLIHFPKIRTLLAILGAFLLFILLVFRTIKDLNSSLSHWYFKATWVWLIVMTMGSVWFYLFWLKNKNGKSHFEELPEG